MKTIAVDTGGTFTDMVVLEHETGEVEVLKTPSTPHDPGQATLDGLAELIAGGLRAEEVASFTHGTTVGTNILVQDKGARVGLLITDGFSGVNDVWHIPRFGSDLSDIYVEKNPPVEPWLREEVVERVDFQGNVKKPLDVNQAREAVKRLKRKGAESIAVVLLFSFLNPTHERALAEMLAEEFPDGSVSLSSEILPQIREFPRLSTTVANARLAPAMTEYLGKLAQGLKGLGITTEQLYIMQSNGGVAKITSVIPITTLLSGPCAGSEAGMQIAASAGFTNMVSFDMGGTSSDIALGEDGRVLEQTSVLIGDWEIAAPMLMINTIGAGGGTIAWIDGGGALQVGPHSAGAEPGPVAYDKGGTQPTVTDADLILGMLHPEYLLGGKVKTNKQKAYEAIADMGAQLGIDPMGTAEGIIRIINAKMEEGIREVSTERGYDLRNFVLVAFGGAGPVHAARLAADLGMSKVVVPPMPGVSSALGLIMADPRRDFVRSRLRGLADIDASELSAVFTELRQQALSEFVTDGFDGDSIEFAFSLDLRYQGQGYELNVAAGASATLDSSAIAELRERFDRAHEQLFGHSAKGEPVEAVNYRVRSTVRVPKFSMKRYDQASGPADAAKVDEREVYFDRQSGMTPTPVFDRALLSPGHEVVGPAIVEQLDSTTVIYPGQRAVVDDYRNLVISTA